MDPAQEDDPVRISEQTREALKAAHDLVARDEALSEVVTLLDPTGTRSAWAIAGDIQEARRRLARALPRIVARGRDPTPLEAALITAEEAGLPRSRRRIWDLLVQLGD
jgi:hypothetical protein